MADQAFSNAGLGMFGQDAAIAKQMSTPDSFQEKAAKAASAGGAASPLAILANKAFETLSSAFSGSPQQAPNIQGAVAPTGQASPVAPVAPVNSVAPVTPVSGVAPVTAPAATDPTKPTTGGYRSFFSAPSFGVNQ